MWGSYFSRKDGPALSRPLRRFWSRVRLEIGKPVPAHTATAKMLEEEVSRMLGDAPRR
jgi:hypothetical protein